MDTFFNRWPLMYSDLKARAEKFSSAVSVKTLSFARRSARWQLFEATDSTGSSDNAIVQSHFGQYQYFLEQFEVLLESCCQMSNWFFVDDMNIDLLQTSAIGNKYSNSLKFNGCYQGKKEPTRVTLTSVSLLDHIVHNDCLNKLEFGVIKTNITDHYATYVQLDITKSQSIRFQQTRATMPFL